MDAATAGATQSVAFQYGVLGVVALVFAYVIVALYRRGEKKDEKIIEDRSAWAAKEQGLRADYEARHSAALVEYAKQLQDLRAAGQDREDAIRKEFSDLMEHISEEATKTSNATIDVLHKFYDRILGPKVR